MVRWNAVSEFIYEYSDLFDDMWERITRDGLGFLALLDPVVH